jgi:hypothetical protein
MALACDLTLATGGGTPRLEPAPTRPIADAVEEVVRGYAR